jgi:tRNA-dihydrouridine synthase A
MIGRAAYKNPFLIATIDNLIFNNSQTLVTRKNILEKYKSYAEKQIQKGVSLSNLTRHIIGLYQGQPGARKFRQMLSSDISKNKNNIHFFEKIIKSIA